MPFWVIIVGMIIRKKTIENSFMQYLNNLSLKRKLWLLYTFCVIIPLVITDSLFAAVFIHNAKMDMQKSMEMAVFNAQIDFQNAFDPANNLANSIYINENLNYFLERRFSSPRYFYSASRDAREHAGYSSILAANNSILDVVMCANNASIVNGGAYSTIERVSDTDWYTDFIGNNRANAIYFYYVEGDANLPVGTSARRVSIVRDLDHFTELPSEKVLRIDISYPRISEAFSVSRYGSDIYICDGDRIVISTKDKPNETLSYKQMNAVIMRNIGYVGHMTYLGKEYTIMVERPSDNYFVDTVREHSLFFILLVTLNIFFPIVLVNLINRSFTDRLQKLSHAFQSTNKGELGLKEVDSIQGKDEIGQLTEGYNDLVRRNKQLIKTIYEDRIVHQKVEIEKQQAELLSMRMQINPHFIFNVLENLRMNCIVKGETETAIMIERLAALERESVDWKNDVIPLAKELEFVRNYLNLQAMRYGDRFSFSINADDDALRAYIPKLTLTTFVENSCVHGVEKKSSDAMILVDCSVKDGKLILEVEDTGAGMSPVACAALESKMQRASFSQLQRSSKHIGMINSCLRIKLLAGEENTKFTFEGEENVGVYLRIEMPIINRPNTEGDNREDA